MSIGMGIGAAIFFDGRLYTGNDGLAGELGHVSVHEMASFVVVETGVVWNSILPDQPL
jgi:predicted NBD/HSP70 family sugar kinase